jgi:hypothetical protein
MSYSDQRYAFINNSLTLPFPPLWHEEHGLRSSVLLFIMDHEKPQVVLPQLQEYDVENSEEPEYVEDCRERKGESVWYVLKSTEL